MSEPVETVHDRGRAALLAGTELLDTPPGVGSPRWGVSVVLRPDPAGEQRLASVTAQLAEVAGPGQWQTGGVGASHLTVRSLEPYRSGVMLEDRLCRAHAAALERAASGCGPVTFTVTGLVLAPRGVLAAAEPVDAAAERLRARLVDELDDRGSYEGDYRGDRWWASLLHFASPVRHRAELVRWVEARQSLDLGTVVSEAVDLVRYEYDGDRTIPATLARFGLTGRSAG